MGGNSSTLGESDTDRERILKRAGPQLVHEEGQAIKKLFVAIAGSTERLVYEERHLQEYFQQSKVHLPKSSVTGLFNALLGDDRDKFRQYTQNENPQQSFTPFVRHICHILKGTLSEKSERMYILCSRSSSSLTLSSLEASLFDLISAICESKCVSAVYPQMSEFFHDSKSDQRLSLFLTESLRNGHTPSDTNDFEISRGLFEDWLSKSELAQKIFYLTFSSIFYQEVLPSGEDKDVDAPLSILADFRDSLKTSTHWILVPMKVPHPIIREVFDSKLLDISSLMLINNYVPADVRGKLYPLFSSYHHGESYSMFCKQLVAAQGPTLIVVKDTDGHIFGGFAVEKWQFGPKFKGDANCFLFSLAPEVGVYLPSGYNENYMYLEQNAQTLPNGLGMGGQMEYFGLWLSADYGQGHSKARPKCSTYNSPRLSKEEEFKVQHLEVWGVGDPVLPDKDEEDGRPSILDKDKTAASFLEMAGKKLYSKDLRETPEEDWLVSEFLNT